MLDRDATIGFEISLSSSAGVTYELKLEAFRITHEAYLIEDELRVEIAYYQFRDLFLEAYYKVSSKELVPIMKFMYWAEDTLEGNAKFEDVQQWANKRIKKASL